jgi:hypothetical protein
VHFLFGLIFKYEATTEQGQLAGFVASFGFIAFLVFTVRLPGVADACLLNFAL